VNTFTNTAGLVAQYLTFNNTTQGQTSNQLGATFSSPVRAIAGASIPNGSISSPGFCSLSLSQGTYVIQCTCKLDVITSPVSFTYMKLGLST
jgi:hypothetical protein